VPEKAIINLFQVDLDKLRNYLWYCYEKQCCWRFKGCKRTPKSFDLLNLDKIPENPGENGAQRCLTSKNGAQDLQKNTWRPFLEVKPKKVLMISVGEYL